MATSKPLPPVELLRQEVRYDPETGLFWWLKKLKNRRMNVPAGGKCVHGYVRLKIGGHTFKAHRLAWLMHYGVEPPPGMSVDHINRDKSDNRICNLRLADNYTQNQNRIVSTDPMRSIVRRKNRLHCWRVHIRRNWQIVKIPHFKCLGQAIKARNAFERAEPLGLKSAKRYG